MRVFRLLALSLLISQSAYAGVPKNVTLDIQNMTCSVCPVTVKKALEHTAGVSKAQIDFDRKTASVTYDPQVTDVPALIQSTTNAGYPSTLRFFR